MVLYPSSVEKNLSGWDIEYVPKPMLPLNPFTGMTFTTGTGRGADVHGCMPTSLALGMKIEDGRKSGIRFGTESTGGMRVSPERS